LIRWSLGEHARHPNETNLDAHYFLPPSGLWSTYLHSPETIIQPCAASLMTSPLPDASGPRRLVSNTPASPATFSLLKSTPRLPPVPSIHAQPLSAAELIPRLRWANIGWSYHWGTKLYDFTREVQPVGEPFRKVCIEVVRSINWHDVFGSPDAESLDGWGDDGPDWQAWEETYGQYPKRSCCARIIRICGYHSSCALVEPDAGIVNFYQTKDTLMGHVDRSEICATSPLVSIS
jgi:alkylated DNA repair protein alkB family protein 1